MTEHRDPLSDYTWAERHIYGVLRRNAPITFGDLHHETGVSEATLSRALGRFQRDEPALVECETPMDDRRKRVYRPTDHFQNERDGED